MAPHPDLQSHPHRLVAVVGGTGFIGRALVGRLLAQGHTVRVATRSRAHARELLTLPIQLVECDVSDARQLACLLAGTDALVNLVGILHGGAARRGEPYSAAFARAHVALPTALVAACREQKVRRVLHVSALGAGADAPSMYLRSKGDGEQVLRGASDLATTIFQPSVVFGPGDRFLNMFAKLQRVFPFMPLACAGARFQPVYVADLAQAIVTALTLSATQGQTYEIGGPRVYTLEQLVRLVGVLIGRPRPVLRLSAPLARLQAALLKLVPGEPALTRDALDSMRIDSVLSAPLDPILNLRPASIEVMAPRYLRPAS